MLDPAAQPTERLLRGLQLAQDPLRRRLKSLRQVAREADSADDATPDSEIVSSVDDVTALQERVQRLVRDLHAELEAVQKHPGSKQRVVPSATERVTGMLCNEMGMPYEIDAYNRMSGIVHTKALAIISTWNWDTKRPSIDYFSFLEFLHLALCSTEFMLGRRAACWGENRKSKKLHTIIDCVERILDGEPGAQSNQPCALCNTLSP